MSRRLHDQPFKLERYFAQYEFKAPYLLSASDCEALTLGELLEMADPEAAGLWAGLSLGYTESAGHPALRREIAGLYETLAPENVLVLAPEEGIFIAMHTLLEPGDRAIALFPAYQSLHEIARSAGAQVIPWVVQPQGDGWRLDLEWLERNLDETTRLLVINFPHNPTGFLPTRQELDHILGLARKWGPYVFSDEMYRLLEYDPARRLPPVCDLYERGISLSGMSKSFSLPGLRIGWLGTRAAGLLERWQAYKDYTTICSSAPSEVLALIGLRARQRILERNLAIIRDNLAHAGAFFGRHADRFHWLPPQAGSVAFPAWLGPGRGLGRTLQSLEDFCREMLDRQGLMVVPGSLFDYAPPEFGAHFRVGLGRRNFKDALQRMG
jgi:aspartate/methionine/tyrosine aminotransferase